MLQIYIYGKYESGWLDMQPSTELSMEKFTALFDEDLQAGEFSLPVEFPWTDNNRRLMGFAERISNFDKLIPFWTVDIYDKGFPEMVHAKLTLLEKEGDFNFSRGKFNASISGNKGHFGSAIKNKTLRNIALGDDITWSIGDSRTFATNLIKGSYPQYGHISFAPIVNENFFDQSKNYNGEFIYKDTLNNIVKTGPGAADWQFGRPSSVPPGNLTMPGNPEYIDHRTVPFFNFQYILTKAFAAANYTAQCDICTNPAFKDLYIFNNTALEFYSTTAYQDFTKKINPADHVPDLSLADFFQMVFSFFNLYPVFKSNNNIEVFYRDQVFGSLKILDITKLCSNKFTATYATEEESDGYTLAYEWAEEDDYFNDRVKDIDPATVIATVNTLPELATLSIGRPLTTDDIAFVRYENMHYKVADASSNPLKWDAWSEGLNALKVGNGDREVKLPISTLCNYVELDEPTAVYVRRNKLCTRQAGSYWNNTYAQVKNKCSLRLFFIHKYVIAGNNIPVSSNLNSTPSGTIFSPYSLALNTSDGIGRNFHKQWQDAKNSSNKIKVEIQSSRETVQALDEHDIVRINNVLYLPVKYETSIPLANTITAELLPL